MLKSSEKLEEDDSLCVFCSVSLFLSHTHTHKHITGNTHLYCIYLIRAMTMDFPEPKKKTEYLLIKLRL